MIATMGLGSGSRRENEDSEVGHRLVLLTQAAATSQHLRYSIAELPVTVLRAWYEITVSTHSKVHIPFSDIVPVYLRRS